ncbi:hypothetical protein DIURU_001203 [Diutina rugosa]|uniref:HECT-type E3 ubiquitin transferase n=1 Tax=Diutina rugosa TaxID=5481 RepID=A0A642UUZ6_DIURU|nr:uncharacterized protein DIURU_001203 [Diutina rugosa]KAA8906021.1 hypothetical protein DIURU_001203 [Diutina rugosa]
MLRRHSSVPSKKSRPPPYVPASKPKFTRDVTADPTEFSTHRCGCCGATLQCPLNEVKIRCVGCGTTTVFQPGPKDSEGEPMNVNHIRDLARQGMTVYTKETLHQAFEPLSEYLYLGFSRFNSLNRSFRKNPRSRNAHYSSSNLDYDTITKVYLMLTRLPTKLPLYRALSGASDLLKRLVPRDYDDPRNFLWILIILENPFLNRALVLDPNPDLRQMANAPEIKVLCHDLLKRGLGVLANNVTSKSLNYLASWFSKMPPGTFTARIDLINHFITFHLKTYYQLAQKPESRRRSVGHSSQIHDAEYTDYVALKRQFEDDQPHMSDARSTNSASLSRSRQKSATRITIHQYGNNWQIEAASKVMNFFLKANTIRGAETVPISNFYNSLVDFVDILLDFDSWLRKRQTTSRRRQSIDGIPTDIDMVLETLHGSRRTLNETAKFYFCQYPFLISLGSKMRILAYEARRQMERKAEEAFITGLDQNTQIEVYFKIVVRRDHIISDSLAAIKHNPNNLKKTLRVKFTDEPGIDAGGIKKEWFLLLTRNLFSQSTGMFVHVDDSNYLWFSLYPREGSDVFYLLGAVLGLAVYNSTILDLHFPLGFYKILLGQRLNTENFQQLYPTTYANLLKLRELSDDDLKALDLTFETSVTDSEGRVHNRELTPGGSKVVVTKSNLEDYISNYCSLFIHSGIKSQARALNRGFQQVCGGTALSLFSAEEIQLVLCGSSDTHLDVDTLRAVTKYVRFGESREDAEATPVIRWFWHWLTHAPTSKQRKFLIFVTGSDRIPATGIQNMSFKISNAGNDKAHLPIAHTCFNELSLYNYPSYDTLSDKLNMAVYGSAGFGIK